MEVTVGLSGQTHLCLDGYLYSKKAHGPLTVRWRCVQRKKYKCRGGVTTSSSYPYEDPKNFSAHTHPPDEFLKKASHVRLKLRQSVEENPDMRVSEVIREVLQDFTEEEIAKLGNMATLERDLRRSKTNMRRLKNAPEGSGAKPASCNVKMNLKKKKTPSKRVKKVVRNDKVSTRIKLCSVETIDNHPNLLHSDETIETTTNEKESQKSCEPLIELVGGPLNEGREFGRGVQNNLEVLSHNFLDAHIISQCPTLPTLEKTPPTHTITKLVSLVQNVSQFSSAQCTEGITNFQNEAETQTDFHTPSMPSTQAALNTSSHNGVPMLCQYETTARKTTWTGTTWCKMPTSHSRWYELNYL